MPPTSVYGRIQVSLTCFHHSVIKANLIRWHNAERRFREPMWCRRLCLSAHKAVDCGSMFTVRILCPFHLFGNLKQQSIVALLKHCIRYINIADLRTCLFKSTTSTLLPLTGGGHLHSEDWRPDIYLSVLSADPEKRLHPRFGHLFPHRVHQMS